MKGLKLKSIAIAATLLLLGGVANTVSAQRRGMAGGRVSGMSRGHSGVIRGGGLYAGQRNRIAPFRYNRGPYVRSYSRVYPRAYVPGRFGFYYRPHLGLRVSVLPFGYYPFYFGNTQFFYSGGLYYRQDNNSYKVVVPPVGAQVPNIPSEAEEVTINGQTYYEYKGVYYSPTVDANGKTVYIIAGKDGVLNTPESAGDGNSDIQIGDEVSVLPANVREVTLKGEKYYVSEDGVYYQDVSEGNQTTYRVVGL